MSRLPILALVSVTSVGCGSWPRFAHLPPEDSSPYLAPGEEPPTPDAEVAWAQASVPAEPGNDAPSSAPLEVLSLGAGEVAVSYLSGTGWQAGQGAERPEDCGEASGFPPDVKGAYVGDVDWRVIAVGSAGVLCNGFYADVYGSQVDVTLYPLDDCGIPGPPVEGGDGEILGFGVFGTVNTWQAAVEPAVYGVAAAGWSPIDPENEVPYHWGLSLLEGDGSTELPCPLPPGADPDVEMPQDTGGGA